MSERFKKWFCGGQDLAFFHEHNDSIIKHNGKVAGVVLIVMSLVTLAYFIFDLNSWGVPAMRTSYIIFCCVTVCSHVLDVLVIRKKLTHSGAYYFWVMELVFLFLLFVGPIYDSSTIAVYIPVFFLAAPLLPIIPLYRSSIVLLVDAGIFAFIDYYFKASELATFDLINSVTCLALGLVLGSSILRDRLGEIYAFAQLKESSESALSNALRMANTDPLTGVRSRAAYEHMETLINESIEAGDNLEFGLVFCDINWLKETNDTQGHDIGDRLIRRCCKLICDIFAHSPVFRIGGDEFVVFLQGDDYIKRDYLMLELSDRLKGPDNDISFATGIAVFVPGKDYSMERVFIRADEEMYKNKTAIKAGKKLQSM